MIWYHFIGICGVTMAPVALLLKNLGFEVTGSDKKIFPPASLFVRKNKLNLVLGFKPEHLKASFYNLKNCKKKPDFVVFGGFMKKTNPEIIEAKRLNIPIISYPEIINQFILKKNSIVIVGSQGKTTTSYILTKIFKSAKIDASFMYGGFNSKLENPIHKGTSSWSIIEGDEYFTSKEKQISKFFFYNPKYLIFTGAQWDHQDVFKTEKSYIDNFIKLVKSIPKDGIIAANLNGKNLKSILKNAKCKVVWYYYGTNKNKLKFADYACQKNSFNLLEISIRKKEKFTINVKNIIADYIKENAIACFALANELKISKKAIFEGIKKFDGIKRRMEIRFKSKNLVVIDDFSGTLAKVEGTLKSISTYFKNFKIISIFEPNIGILGSKDLKPFVKTFKHSDKVILADFKSKKLKCLISLKNVLNFLKENGVNSEIFSDDKSLLKELQIISKNSQKTVICFMGSYSFHYLIELFVSQLKNEKN